MDEKFALRQLLWLHHGCPSSSLYGDDGEMQCNNIEAHKPINFKRDKVDDIRVKFMLDPKKWMEIVKEVFGKREGRMDEKVKDLLYRFGKLVGKVENNNLRSDFLQITYEFNDLHSLLKEKEKEIEDYKTSLSFSAEILSLERRDRIRTREHIKGLEKKLAILTYDCP